MTKDKCSKFMCSEFMKLQKYSSSQIKIDYKSDISRAFLSIKTMLINNQVLYKFSIRLLWILENASAHSCWLSLAFGNSKSLSWYKVAKTETNINKQIPRYLHVMFICIQDNSKKVSWFNVQFSLCFLVHLERPDSTPVYGGKYSHASES